MPAEVVEVLIPRPPEVKSPRKKKVKSLAKKKAVIEKPAPSKKSKKASKPKKRGPRGNPPDKVARRGDARYGARVAKARARKEWTQKQAAAKLGITQPGLCNVEKGTVGASKELKKRIKRVLGA